MATNNHRWLRNELGASKPFIMPGLFQAGATQAIFRGELLERTASTNTKWVPMDSDYDMTGTSDAVAVAGCQIKSGDLAGYYPIQIPRPGDVWKFDLLSTDTQNPTYATAVYWSDSETVTTTAGTNILGYTCGASHYPLMQGFASDGDPIDRGTTLRNVSGGEIEVSIQHTNSLWSGLFSE